MKIAIFRIIQESLNNIIKHAQATHANIYLRFEEKNVRINVRDNGIGFDLEHAQQQAHPAVHPWGWQACRNVPRCWVELFLCNHAQATGQKSKLDPLSAYREPVSTHSEEVKDDHTSVSGG